MMLESGAVIVKRVRPAPGSKEAYSSNVPVERKNSISKNRARRLPGLKKQIQFGGDEHFKRWVEA